MWSPFMCKIQRGQTAIPCTNLTGVVSCCHVLLFYCMSLVITCRIEYDNLREELTLDAIREYTHLSPTRWPSLPSDVPNEHTNHRDGSLSDPLNKQNHTNWFWEWLRAHVSHFLTTGMPSPVSETFKREYKIDRLITESLRNLIFR